MEEAMGLALATSGANVTIVSRNWEESQKAADAIAAKTGRQTQAMRVDVTVRDDVERELTYASPFKS